MKQHNLNARIRKAFIKNKIKIYSIGNPFYQTYPFFFIGDDTNTINEILGEKHNFNKILEKSKKPIIIIGESALELESGKFIFEGLKNFKLKKTLLMRNGILQIFLFKMLQLLEL